MGITDAQDGPPLEKASAPPAEVDYGAEDYEFPDLDGLDPEEAGEIWDAIERAATDANKRAARLKDRRAVAKQLTLQAIENSPFKSVTVEGAEGRDVRLTPYDWTVFKVVDEEQFKAWAEGERERYYDETPRLRESVFLEEMRRRDNDKEPLPPGVTSWTDVKISRTTAPAKRRKRA